MRFLWPCAGNDDLRKMKGWCEKFALNNLRFRVPPPKVLPPNELEALKAVFKFYDKDSSGSVTAEELIHTGLLDKDTARKYVFEKDADGDGDIHYGEFIAWLCHEDQLVVSRVIGTATLGNAAAYKGDDRLRVEMLPKAEKKQEREKVKYMSCHVPLHRQPQKHNYSSTFRP